MNDYYLVPQTKPWQQALAVVLIIAICVILWCALWVVVGVIAAVAWFFLEAGWQMI